MMYLVLFVILCASALADYQPQYSYSPAVGSGSGTPYAVDGQGRITAVRGWEHYNGHVRGIQFQFDHIWTNAVGDTYGNQQELTLTLFEGESIVQVSGKHNQFIQQLVFTTSRGRSLSLGQPQGNSFNFYPLNSQAELRLVSGRVKAGLTSIGAHWGVIHSSSTYLD